MRQVLTHSQQTPGALTHGVAPVLGEAAPQRSRGQMATGAVRPMTRIHRSVLGEQPATVCRQVTGPHAADEFSAWVACKICPVRTWPECIPRGSTTTVRPSCDPPAAAPSGMGRLQFASSGHLARMARAWERRLPSCPHSLVFEECGPWLTGPASGPRRTRSQKI